MYKKGNIKLTCYKKVIVSSKDNMYTRVLLSNWIGTSVHNWKWNYIFSFAVRCDYKFWCGAFRFLFSRRYL